MQAFTLVGAFRGRIYAPGVLAGTHERAIGDQALVKVWKS